MFTAFLGACALACGLATLAPAPVLAQRTANDPLAAVRDLAEKMATAPDPCPYAAEFRRLVMRVDADLRPGMLQAADVLDGDCANKRNDATPRPDTTSANGTSGANATSEAPVSASQRAAFVKEMKDGCNGSYVKHLSAWGGDDPLNGDKYLDATAGRNSRAVEEELEGIGTGMDATTTYQRCVLQTRLEQLDRGTGGGSGGRSGGGAGNASNDAEARERDRAAAAEREKAKTRAIGMTTQAVGPKGSCVRVKPTKQEPWGTSGDMEVTFELTNECGSDLLVETLFAPVGRVAIHSFSRPSWFGGDVGAPTRYPGMTWPQYNRRPALNYTSVEEAYNVFPFRNGGRADVTLHVPSDVNSYDVRIGACDFFTGDGTRIPIGTARTIGVKANPITGEGWSQHSPSVYTAFRDADLTRFDCFKVPLPEPSPNEKEFQRLTNEKPAPAPKK